MKTDLLLSRDVFRESVFKRDNYKCVICGNKNNLSAHHIIERRLWDDGGYYLNNGASLCEVHHIQAEQTVLSCEEIREKCKIKNTVLPYHMYDDNDYTYDKWGNIIMPNGTRLRGELFNDESVQKILKEGNVLDLFSKYIKYQRTLHLPWSEKFTKDDRILNNVDHFIGKEVVATIKMDGENTSMYRDYVHARSINSGSHPSRNMVKQIWSRFNWEIPEGWRFCGENMYAVHSLQYSNLESYFLLFSIWNENNICLSWDETLEYAELLGIKTVPVIYRGIFDEEKIKSLYKPALNGDPAEGYVIRLTSEFKYSEFRKSLAKFVSGNFNIKHGHWSQHKVEKNKLKNG